MRTCKSELILGFFMVPRIDPETKPTTLILRSKEKIAKNSYPESWYSIFVQTYIKQKQRKNELRRSWTGEILCFSSSRFSASRVRDFEFVNGYTLFWIPLNMANWGGEFSFFQGIHVRIDIRIYISISLKPMTEFGKQIHLGELAQMRLIKQVPVTSSLQDHATN